MVFIAGSGDPALHKSAVNKQYRYRWGGSGNSTVRKCGTESKFITALVWNMVFIAGSGDPALRKSVVNKQYGY